MNSKTARVYQLAEYSSRQYRHRDMRQLMTYVEGLDRLTFAPLVRDIAALTVTGLQECPINDPYFKAYHGSVNGFVYTGRLGDQEVSAVLFDTDASPTLPAKAFIGQSAGLMYMSRLLEIAESSPIARLIDQLTTKGFKAYASRKDEKSRTLFFKRERDDSRYDLALTVS